MIGTEPLGIPRAVEVMDTLLACYIETGRPLIR